MQDESKMSASDLLKLRKMQFMAAQREAADTLERMEAAHRKANAEFKVARSNPVRNLNKARNEALDKVRAEADASIAKAQAEAHKIVDAATTAANAKVEAARQSCGAEFNAKSSELAAAFEKDHAALIAKQTAERAQAMKAADKAHDVLMAQIMELETKLADEAAEAVKLADEKTPVSDGTVGVTP